MTVQPQAATDISCIEVSACSGGNFVLKGCTLTNDQTITANGNLQPDPSSVVNSNVEYAGGISSGTYNGTKTSLSAGRVLPDVAHVFDYYKANGTAISYTQLVQSNTANIVPNGSFETNVAGWYVSSPSSGSVVLSQDTTQHKDGADSLKLTGRATAADLPAIDLPLNTIRNGDVYQIQLPAYAKSTGSVQAQLLLVSDTGTQTFTTPAQTFTAAGSWKTSTGNVTASWSGNLQKATLQVFCSDNSCDLYLDAVRIVDSSFGPTAYVMDRVVLSPTQNPFGTPNAQGIYVVDCGNQDLTISSCRIVGTLMLLHATNKIAIKGPISWEPAVSGFPALLCDNQLNLTMDSNVGMSESTLGANFNPPGTPYPFVNGSSNTNVTDAYPTTINGLIYCDGNLVASGALRVNGTLIATDDIQINATSINLTYNSASYVSPPPGFGSGAVIIKPVPGSWQRVIH